MKKGFVLCEPEYSGKWFFDAALKYREYCDVLVLGVPDDELFSKMYNTEPEFSFNEKISAIKSCGIIDEVVSVDSEHITLQALWAKLHFDVFFYGTEYGLPFESDCAWASEKQIEMISLQPNKRAEIGFCNSLARALKSFSVEKKIVLFGTGAYFDIYMRDFGNSYPPVYAVDNNKNKWNTHKNGIKILPPETLKSEQNIVVVICSKNYIPIREQLRNLGNPDYRLMHTNDYISDFHEYAIIHSNESSYLEHAHTILTVMMREFDRICTAYDINYYVRSGTLIGVVRHQGLIPWDDDVDIHMPRIEFEKFRAAAKREWNNNSSFELIDYDELGRNAFYDFMTRIVYKGETIPTELFSRGGKRIRKDILNKMVVDIYILDNAEDTWKHKVVTKCIQLDYVLAMGHRGFIDYSDYDRLPGKQLKILKVANWIGRIIPLKFICFMYERHRRYALKKKTKYYFESGGVITSCMDHLYDKSFFGKGLRLPMCGINVMVPENYDAVLKENGYADYMTYPPPYQRHPSHMKGMCKVLW